jgi:CheY-specific phosphatase CheX/ActR/RegA family two-component response regulator
MGRILLIDDDEGLLGAYEMILKKADFKVAKAFDGRDALLKIGNEQFDLIVTDIKMPKLSGLDLIEALQKRETAGIARCPIIISSGFIEESVYSKYSNIGRIHFLPKPVDKKDLLAKVRLALNVPVKRPHVDVRFVNPILSAVSKMVTELSGVALSPGTPYLKKPGEVSGDISGIVGVISPGFRGNISLSFDETGFLKLVTKFTKIEFKEIGDEVRDAISELLTTIFNEAKKELARNELEIETSVPSIVTGKSHCVDHKLSAPAVTVLFSNAEFGECRVEICILSTR